MNRLKLKICGMTDQANINDVLSVGPDYLGFIFYASSKRYVKGLSADFVRQLTVVQKVGVFVDASLDDIKQAIIHYGLDFVQLHGQEQPDFVQQVKALNVRIIKAFGMAADFDWQCLRAYQEMADYFLFDTKTSSHGGSGEVFDWTLLQQYPLQVPYFLSGGLSLTNLVAVNTFDDPRLYALDVNSKFESSPGFKDIQLLKQIKK
ncbi:phosphoribosylanthranilate isomerase [Olivibacter ginsenosidimutans]|uniref:N-(5'-phosphoribosyl)anthranilate isomerase n=1 Tax=Olivibacter ginsenosidimutans TaxID=1176537 RepID=A0ABP9B577_9SPHI